MMRLSPHSLHPILIESASHRADVGLQLQSIADKQQRVLPKLAARAATDTVGIPLTTVSLASNFDAYINIRFQGQPVESLTSLVVDSGNSNLIVPSWEAIQNLPAYTVLGDGKEPWGSPAKIVKGPIEIPTASGDIHVLDNCVFYACTGEPRTANFGAGRLLPWSANGWSTPPGIGVTMQAPLSYNSQYPFAEFNYAPASSVLAMDNTPRVAQESELTLYRSQPLGYSMLNLIPNLEWMSLIPKSLTVGDVLTQWPGNVGSPIAVVDTGGGPVFLSDPNGYVYSSAWPNSASCPTWTSSSQLCNCVSADVTLELGSVDQTSTIKYTIHTGDLPTPVQGLTLVMCKVNWYMMGQQGMNIGGISALFNVILIDYTNGKVGLRPKIIVR